MKYIVMKVHFEEKIPPVVEKIAQFEYLGDALSFVKRAHFPSAYIIYDLTGKELLNTSEMTIMNLNKYHVVKDKICKLE
jgi:hypothetical protein